MNKRRKIIDLRVIKIKTSIKMKTIVFLTPKNVSPPLVK